MRRRLATAIGGVYWLWALVALGGAYLALAGSEQPPFREETLLLRIGLASWVLSSIFLIGLVRSWKRLYLVGLWSAQALLALVAFYVTWDFGYVDPDGVPVGSSTDIKIGIVGELAGLLAIALKPRQGPSPAQPSSVAPG